MIDIIKDILQFLAAHNSINIPIVSLIVIISVLSIWNSKEKIEEFLGIKIKKKVKIKNVKELFNHDLFIKLPHYYNIASRSNFGDPINNEIFYIILTTKVKSTVDITKGLLRRIDINNMNVNTLECYLLENSRKIVNDYNNKIKEQFRIKYNVELGDKIYEYVMNTQVIGFNSVHDKQLIHTDSILKDVICNPDNTIFDNIFRLEIYLYELNSTLYSSMVDAENIFYKFNGHLDEIKRKINENRSIA